MVARTPRTEIKRPPEAGRPEGGSSVEIYRGVHGQHSWRVVALAKDDSEAALRAAQTLALELEAELHAELSKRRKERGESK